MAKFKCKVCRDWFDSKTYPDGGAHYCSRECTRIGKMVTGQRRAKWIEKRMERGGK